MTDLSIAQFPGLSAIARDYRAILCDVWGVLHNGVTAFKPACEALTRFRQGGGLVVLVTNAARPAAYVADQLVGFGVPKSAYDGIVTSGDATREQLLDEGVKRVFHLGPDRDLPLFEDFPVDRVGVDEAEIVVCTGLIDEKNETPEDYHDQLRGLAAKNLRFLCANPDIVVEIGDKQYWCAGALARVYAAIGGNVVFPGKPHPPIYRAAMARLAEVAGTDIDRSRILAIGDGLPTDIAGAVGQGFPALFVTGGIHAADFGETENPDPVLIAKRLEKENAAVVGTLPRLRW